ncbi:MAG: sulfide/dihydroorotate dehydrogenase-like FAD/NAD-binding protein [Candidatus Brockarchaeota archaeon]|nr:sulfide/dihydroorotate dehydrogenase-like FAD/NAD-binding protein [Candidatus Brockarchaeota archaeon]
MHRIVSKKQLAPNIHSIEVEFNPRVAAKIRPGQFVMIRIDEQGERIPLTPVSVNKDGGSLTFIFQEVGRTTRRLGMLKEGDSISDVVGPLGTPSEIRRYGTVAVVGGGIGTACVYPEARALKEAGNAIISIIGARSGELLILEEEMKSVSDRFYVTTDDGTKGRRGFVTDMLREVVEAGEKLDLAIAVGPAVMMKSVSDLTRRYGIKTLVSLNPIMVDGTGMCGSCRVIVGGETKFACVDGPTFDAHLVDFDHLLSRLKMYAEEERLALRLLEQGC